MQIQGMKYLGLISTMEYTVIITLLYLILAGCKIDLEEVSMNSDCVCLGDTLTYECTVVGDRGGITIWMGDFFQCPNGKPEIGLLHNNFVIGQAGGVCNAPTCNNGNVVGGIIRYENGVFTSQLNVTLTPDIVGRSIECAYDNGTIHRIGSLNITEELIVTKQISWDSNFCPLSDVHFKWDTLPPECSTSIYNILASNCGSCPTTTNSTNVTCTDVPTNGSIICEFSVQSANCSRRFLTQNITVMQMCPSVHQGENESSILLMVVIVALAILILLLVVLVPFLFHISKRRLLSHSRQITFHTAAHHEERDVENYYGKLSQAEVDKEAIKIFDNTSNGTYNLVELDTIHNEQQPGRQRHVEDETKITKIFDNRLNGIYNIVKLDTIQNKMFKLQQLQESVQGSSIQLTLNNLLIKLQGRISSQWYQLGLAIGMPDDALEQLKDYSDEDALVEVLDYWLKDHSSRPSTWQDVATTLKTAGLTGNNVE